MRRIDELHLNLPFAGARMLRDMLKLEGFEVGKHVRTLMGRMGVAAVYRERKTSMDGKGRWVGAERLRRAVWKSVTYEHVYLHAHNSMAEARRQLGSYRPHSSLCRMTPDTAYLSRLKTESAA